MEAFLKCLRRQVSLIPLMKSCSLILQPLTMRKLVQDLKRIDFSSIHEDVSLLIDQDCWNEVRSLVSFFALEAESESQEDSLTMSGLAIRVKESVHRFIMRNEVTAASHGNTHPDNRYTADGVPLLLSRTHTHSLTHSCSLSHS